MAIRVFVDTTPFVRSHGREPRGRGGWAFSLHRGDGRALVNPAASHLGGEMAQVWFAPGSLTFAEARRWATDLARERGAVEVRALP